MQFQTETTFKNLINFTRLEIRPPSKSKLQQMFDEKVSDPSLEPLFPVIQGLVRFLPSHRISASQALDMLEGQNRKG